MQRVTPRFSSPSCHQITTHLRKIQTRRKAEKGVEAVRRGCSLTSSLCGWAAGFVMLCCCCARAMWNFLLPQKEKDKKREPYERPVAITEKNRYQIKKVCLKTVHMPAPGDFKYLWFATFLIFEFQGCCTQNMMWAYLMSDMTVACKPLQQCEGESRLTQGFLRLTPLQAWPVFSLYPRSKIWNVSLPVDAGPVFAPSYSIPGNTHSTFKGILAAGRKVQSR